MSVTPMKLRLAAAGAVVGLLAGACGDDGGADGPSVDGAWARTSPMMADAGAVYFTLSSDEAVSVVDVSVDESIAARAELHETVMADMAMGDDMDADDMDGDMDSDDMDADEGHDMDSGDMDADEGHDMDSGDMGGAMTMQEVESVPVGAGSSVAFEPGGLHVMLLELADPLELGETFTVTLTLDDGTDFEIDVEVRDEAP